MIQITQRRTGLFLKALAVMVAGAWQVSATAEDIDIFKNNLNNENRQIPNVLLMIDNGTNWESAYSVDGVDNKRQAVSEALVSVTSNDELLGAVNLGLMLLTKESNTKGGKIVAGVSEFNERRQKAFECLAYESKAAWTETVGTGRDRVVIEHPASCSPTNQAFSDGYRFEKGGSSTLGLAFNEAYLYFAGKASQNGRVDGVMRTDWDAEPFEIYTRNRRTNYGNNDRSPMLGADGNIFAEDGVTYVSPAQTNSCANNFVILIGTVNGGLQPSEDAEARAALAAHLGYNPDVIQLNPSNNQSNYADEFARFMSSTDVDPLMEGTQSIMTYVIDVFDPEANDNAPSQAARAFYKSVAANGKGRYFTAADADDVAAALIEILDEVQAINTSFASASMPISMTAENQGTNENQVYIGMFRPDETGRPRWMGNLKRYQYEWDSVLRQPYLADANGRETYDSVTGFINTGAKSFWTRSSSYWDGIPDYEDAPSDSPDGPVVEKGAAGQMLRERTVERELLTCSPDACRNGDRLQAVTIDDPDLQSWLYGYDVGNETQRNDPTERRPSVHGDVLHSRPLVLNYNKGGALGAGEDVVVFYGSNDGVFRAVDGELGKELWALYLQEHRSNLDALFLNAAETDGQDTKHPYFMDGSPSGYTVSTWNDAGDQRYISKAWLYLPMRRGGDFIYALDVSDVDDPRFKWRIKKDDVSFSKLGQTWSSPKVAKVRAHLDDSGAAKPVLFFGAGYDAKAEDYVPTDGVPRPDREVGMGIYMVDADTGERLWYGTANGMDFSVAGDLTLVNYSRNPQGYADRIYFADTGGNIWRANIGAENTSDWSVTKVASLGGECGPTSVADCRKFLYHPSVVVETAGYVSILIGSGDREHPLETTVQNRFFLIKDRGQSTPVTESVLQRITRATTSDDIDATKIANGWYFDLRSGEKVVGNALTLGGATYFNTNTPASVSAGSCVTGLGVAREYIVEYNDPLSVANYLMTTFGEEVAGGGFPPPPVPMTLKFDDEYWSGVGGLKPAAPIDQQPGARMKTFWSRDIDD